MVSFYELTFPGPGRLATMAHPPGGDQLPRAMAALARAGVQTLVSALCDGEVRELALTEQAAEAARVGIECVRLPIVDGGVPEPTDLPAVRRLTERLAGALLADRFVVTHCWAGIGRSSLLAGATLVRLGVDPADAWRFIRTARGLPVPDNPAQEAWLYRLDTL